MKNFAEKLTEALNSIHEACPICGAVMELRYFQPTFYQTRILTKYCSKQCAKKAQQDSEDDALWQRAYDFMQKAVHENSDTLSADLVRKAGVKWLTDFVKQENT